MSALRYCGLSCLALHLLVSCQGDGSAQRMTVNALVKDSVNQMMVNIASDISSNGPVAWLNYFEDSSDFFMASDGQLAFQDHRSAKLFIENTLVKDIRHINLRWSNLRIDPLTPRLASVGANFHEDLVDTAGKMISPDGYFTGIAEQTRQGWQLRNAHWSILKVK